MSTERDVIARITKLTLSGRMRWVCEPGESPFPDIWRCSFEGREYTFHDGSVKQPLLVRTIGREDWRPISERIPDDLADAIRGDRFLHDLMDDLAD